MVEKPTGYVFLRVADVAGGEAWNGLLFFMLPPTLIFRTVVPALRQAQDWPDPVRAGIQ
jgi:hypothetical protein